MKKILVVDDNGAFRDSLVDSLQDMFPDTEILQAQDGAEAKDKLAGYLAEEIPSVLITDYEMPEMNGLELVQFIRNDSVLNSLPIIIMSGLVGERAHILRASSASLGCHFLEKPFRREDLRRVLSEIQ